MEKPTLKVSVSNSDSSSSEDVDESDYEDQDSGLDQDGGDGNNTDDELIIKNEGWADSISKILGSNKPKNKKTLVLSRAKKLADVVIKPKEEKPTFEVIGEEVKEVKPDIKKDDTSVSEPPPKKKRNEKSTVRVKPNILEKDRERLLSKIATKGVVQLFNAVRNQQKTFDREMNKDIPEGKKEKIMKKFDKRAFLDTLMGQTKSLNVEEQTKAKDEVKDEVEKPKWNALRDDFMMGAKMKDWDKESVDE
ncbi:RRP15 protein [Danaus plexippus plexippus]|uniref:RRP15-like protein n=1 Tax=Danaus plexippus plexippus TaxID=278856 RepID=A0A212ER76_DANPL|nr:RRP15 protein [Danaus plexippus plexippus]